MDKSARIYIAGHRGLVGSAIYRELKRQGYKNLITRTHSELDLLDAVAVRKFFDKEQPQYVFLAAAFVGGILANSRYRADFIYKNLGIQQNVIGESYRHHVEKLLFLGSTCIYPANAPQPMKEDCLLTSSLEYTNEPYAIAKIAGLKMCESFNLQYGCNYLAVMPTNLYGPGDNFHLENSHVLPAIMRKMHLAKLLRHADLEALRHDISLRPISGLDKNSSLAQITERLASFGITSDELVLWGSGSVLREFMWSEDMAAACIYVMNHVDFPHLSADAPRGEIRNCHLNVGTGVEHSISQIAEEVRKAVNFEGTIAFDHIHPDGTRRKLTDPSRLKTLGWEYTTSIEEGLPKLYQWYCQTNTL